MINSSSTSAVQSSNECGSSSAIWSSICCSTNTSPSSPSSSSRNQQQHHHHNNNGSQSGGNGHTLHFKILVPAVAAGAIIGKGGETIAHLQKNAGARVKMSKANDFYPGTSERVCLISGTMEGILKIHEFIMEKIKEKPDPNAKMAIDFDHKQPAEREKQVKILVPNSTAGMIIGKGGSFIKQIKEESGAYVQISQKSRDHALAERCITVIGDIECNKKACQMIIGKIVEDPQSGSCLNVSYSDISGPVANFNPTGSPFANTGSSSGGASQVTNSNPSYSSNGSLNSMSPTLINNSPSGPNNQLNLQLSGVGLGHAIPPANSGQMIESLKAMLRVSGYSEDAVTDISSAMNTLANYGLLGLGLGLGGVFNGLNGAPPMMSGLGIGMTSNPNNCGLTIGAVNPNAIYSSQATGVPGIDAGCNNVGPSSNVAGSGSNGVFGPIGSVGGMGHHGFSSPTGTRNSDMLPMTGEGGSNVYDPFRGRSSPTLGSPGAGNSSSAPALQMHNNSFGLGTGLSSPGALRKSPTPTEQQEGMTKIEIEIGDNIVGAILGHGGKSLVEIQRISGANIRISKKGIFAPGTRNRIVTISGTTNAVNTAQYLIEQQINEEENKRRQNAAIGALR